MPNRIIKETICTSENIDALTPEEETFFYRLIVNCDDYGRMDARTPILRAKCFPLKLDKVKDKEIEKWIKNLARQQLIIIYEVEDRLYLQMVTWDKHQQIRAKRSKFPSPEDGRIKLIADDSRCNQKSANVPVIQSNPIQSNPNPIPYKEIIDYLNKKTGKKFSHTGKETKEFINGRWSEGRTLEDFKAVIDNKVLSWKGKTNEKGESMENFLRPSTLFRPTNFENYLNEKGGQAGGTGRANTQRKDSSDEEQYDKWAGKVRCLK